MTGMTDARRALDKYLSQFADSQVVEYACPDCSTMIGALKPPKQRVFDSLASCPDCGEVHYREIFAIGNVRVHTPKQREAFDAEVSVRDAESAASREEAIYKNAVAFVRETGKASIASLQRHLRNGYNDSARLIERMESDCVISAPAHNGHREVLAEK